MARIADSEIERLKAEVSLVRLVESAGVKLARKGKDELTPPGKFDVRGSASITDLADNVFSVWRNRGKELAQDEGRHDKDSEEDALLIVCKHRHGDWEGRIRLWFDRRSQTYLQSQYDHPKAMLTTADDDEVPF